jgi:hypothetical protein
MRMLVDTANIVSVEDFCREVDRFAAAAKEGSGPVAISRDADIIGFFIGPEEYELGHLPCPQGPGLARLVLLCRDSPLRATCAPAREAVV